MIQSPQPKSWKLTKNRCLQHLLTRELQSRAILLFLLIFFPVSVSNIRKGSSVIVSAEVSTELSNSGSSDESNLESIFWNKIGLTEAPHPEQSIRSVNLLLPRLWAWLWGCRIRCRLNFVYHFWTTEVTSSFCHPSESIGIVFEMTRSRETSYETKCYKSNGHLPVWRRKSTDLTCGLRTGWDGRVFVELKFPWTVKT